ncbi:phosphoribosylanthranilate isomerase [Granulicella sp. L60]|uniref:phosphoribosylanthranilate isomerase n=1 Tax=Granulicella sp. L60 TaxID=1641866 RepID=UPI00131C053F|nr:phosphoribosylanthranilate isomerase [Granulicella sp. L60]
MWIKICANTTLEDAKLAAELGADAVGFVFAPSTRRVTPDTVAAITPHLPANVERIGVFTQINAEEIVQVAQYCGLTAVQLHRNVALPVLQRLQVLLDGRIGIIQTVHWSLEPGDRPTSTVIKRLRNIATQNVTDRVLIDSKVGAAAGGSGVPFNWNAARTALQTELQGHGARLKLIVAGGLDSENVDKAIQRLAPWGVDVASGVESEPGRKSPERLAAFIQKARGVNTPAS